METLEQRRKEFLEDTVKYYSEDTSRRATNLYQCMYRTEDGKKCAIGRHIPDDKYSPDMENIGCSSPRIFDTLPIQIKELGVEFLRHIQSLHDEPDYWTSEGLSDYGKRFIDIINYKFKLWQQ